VAAAAKPAMAGAEKLDAAMPKRMLAANMDGHAVVAAAAKQGMGEPDPLTLQS
jgi:hypothetical protein